MKPRKHIHMREKTEAGRVVRKRGGIRWVSIGRSGWLLIMLALVIKVLSLSPGVVEKYYADGVYPYIARGLRILTGWLPFSVGDVLYLLMGGWLLYKLVRFFRAIVKREANRSFFLSAAKRLFLLFLWVYVLFYGLWGLNYTRRGVADQLHLRVHPYSTDELETVLGVIVGRLNSFDSLSRDGRAALEDRRNLFGGAVDAYHELASREPVFSYASPSVKASLFGGVSSYLGIGGYYNPFTGEAQVNTYLPVFTRPFTVCHEMGHQLGYARENEANFAGYLAARSSASPSFRYSVYFDLYTYAARELAVRDSARLRPFKVLLRPGIRQDFKALREFYRRYQSPVEPVFRLLYGRYLKANGQPQGIMTYNEVVAWLIAYYEKYGAAAL